LSLCRCCRACSFWRLLNVDRPLGIMVPQFASPGTPYRNDPAPCVAYPRHCCEITESTENNPL
jgi:hypothetical protein